MIEASALSLQALLSVSQAARSNRRGSELGVSTDNAVTGDVGHLVGESSCSHVSWEDSGDKGPEHFALG